MAENEQKQKGMVRKASGPPDAEPPTKRACVGIEPAIRSQLAFASTSRFTDLSADLLKLIMAYGDAATNAALARTAWSMTRLQPCAHSAAVCPSRTVSWKTITQLVDKRSLRAPFVRIEFAASNDWTWRQLVGVLQILPAKHIQVNVFNLPFHAEIDDMEDAGNGEHGDVCTRSDGDHGDADGKSSETSQRPHTTSATICESIAIRGPQVTPRVLEHIFRHLRLPLLKAIDLVGCHQVNGAWIRSMTRRWPRLEKVALGTLPGISSYKAQLHALDIATLLDGCPAIDTLLLSQTAAGVAELIPLLLLHATRPNAALRLVHLNQLGNGGRIPAQAMTELTQRSARAVPRGCWCVTTHNYEPFDSQFVHLMRPFLDAIWVNNRLVFSRAKPLT
jgi:hypothetical protein